MTEVTVRIVPLLYFGPIIMPGFCGGDFGISLSNLTSHLTRSSQATVLLDNQTGEKNSAPPSRSPLIPPQNQIAQGIDLALKSVRTVVFNILRVER